MFGFNICVAENVLIPISEMTYFLVPMLRGATCTLIWSMTVLRLPTCNQSASHVRGLIWFMQECTWRISTSTANHDYGINLQPKLFN